MRLQAEANMVDGVIPMGGELMLATTLTPPFMRVSAETGEVVGAGPVPWRGFREMSFLQWSGTARHWSGRRWIFGFRAGNGWFVMDGNDVVGAYPYVEHTEFPVIAVTESRSGTSTRTSRRMVARPDYSGFDLSVAGDTLVVLTGGKTEGRFRMLDMYDLDTGQYLRSDALPRRFERIAVTDDVIYATYNEQGFYPALIALRRRTEVQ